MADEELKLPIPVEEGELVTLIEAMREKIQHLSYNEMGPFLAKAMTGIKELEKALKYEAMQLMMKDGIAAYPVGDGRRVAIKEVPEYEVDPDAVEEAQKIFEKQGINIMGQLGKELTWKEKRVATVPILKKALQWGGEGADILREGIEEVNTKRYLRIEGKKKLNPAAIEEAKRSIQKITDKSGWGSEESDG